MAPETNPFGTSENMHALAPDQAPILMHPLGTSENAYTHALAPDQASVLTLPLGTLGTSENARTYTRPFAPVPNLSPRKKKSRQLQCQSRGKENSGKENSRNYTYTARQSNLKRHHLLPSEPATKEEVMDFDEDCSSETEFDVYSCSETDYCAMSRRYPSVDEDDHYGI